MHCSGQCSAVYDSQDLKTTKMSIDREMDKEGMVYTAIKWITSTWNSAQGYVAAWMGVEFGGQWISVYI